MFLPVFMVIEDQADVEPTRAAERERVTFILSKTRVKAANTTVPEERMTTTLMCRLTVKIMVAGSESRISLTSQRYASMSRDFARRSDKLVDTSATSLPQTSSGGSTDFAFHFHAQKTRHIAVDHSLWAGILRVCSLFSVCVFLQRRPLCLLDSVLPPSDACPRLPKSGSIRIPE